MAPVSVAARARAAWPQRNIPSVFTGSYYGYPTSCNGACMDSHFSVGCSSCGSDTFWTKRENFIFAFATLLATAIISETLHQVRVRRTIRRRRQRVTVQDEDSEFLSRSQSESSSRSYSPAAYTNRRRGRSSHWEPTRVDDVRERRYKEESAHFFRSSAQLSPASERIDARQTRRGRSGRRGRFPSSPAPTRSATRSQSKQQRLPSKSHFLRMLDQAARHAETRRRKKSLNSRQGFTKRSWPQNLLINLASQPGAPLISALNPKRAAEGATDAGRDSASSQVAKAVDLPTAAPIHLYKGRQCTVGDKGCASGRPAASPTQRESNKTTVDKADEGSESIHAAAGEGSDSIHAAAGPVGFASCSRQSCKTNTANAADKTEQGEFIRPDLATAAVRSAEQLRQTAVGLKHVLAKLCSKTEACLPPARPATEAERPRSAECHKACDGGEDACLTHRDTKLELGLLKGANEARQPCGRHRSHLHRENLHRENTGSFSRTTVKEAQTDAAPDRGPAQMKDRRRRRRRGVLRRSHDAEKAQLLRELSLARKPLYVAVLAGLYCRMVTAVRAVSRQLPRLLRKRK